MNRKPSDDLIVDFLRAHAPKASEASRDLEQRLFRALDKAQPSAPAEPSRRAGATKSRAALLFIAAAGVLALVWSEVVWVEPSQATAAELEDFVETSWEGTFVNYSELEYRDFMADLDQGL